MRMDAEQAVAHIGQQAAMSVVNGIEFCMTEPTRISETMEIGLTNTNTKKMTLMRITVVVEPQVFGDTVYSSLESSVTAGMKQLDGEDA